VELNNSRDDVNVKCQPSPANLTWYLQLPP
jgi:hypothetical protein